MSFQKTLKNMWVAVSIFNPGMAILALALVPMAVIPQHQEALLTYMGQLSGGNWLAGLISMDAALVLMRGRVDQFCGGSTALSRRMTLDRLPAPVSAQTKPAGNHPPDYYGLFHSLRVHPFNPPRGI